MVVKALPGFVVTIIMFGLWRKLVLNQCQHLGGVEERGEDSGGHSAKSGIRQRREKRGEREKQRLRERRSERASGCAVLECMG